MRARVRACDVSVSASSLTALYSLLSALFSSSSSELKALDSSLQPPLQPPEPSASDLHKDTVEVGTPAFRKLPEVAEVAASGLARGQIFRCNLKHIFP